MFLQATLLCGWLALPAVSWSQGEAARSGQGQSPTHAEPSAVEILTLEDAVTQVDQNNRQVKNAVLDMERADDLLAATRTRQLPHLNLMMFESQLLTPFSFTFGPGSLGTTSTGPIPAAETKFTTNPRLNNFLFATASQPLSQLYRIGKGIDAYEASKEVASEQMRSQRHSVVNSIKRGYFAVLQTQSALGGLEAPGDPVASGNNGGAITERCTLRSP
jgi:outer membrane protein TolC